VDIKVTSSRGQIEATSQADKTSEEMEDEDQLDLY
jgi:hypothetical protein